MKSKFTNSTGIRFCSHLIFILLITNTDLLGQKATFRGVLRDQESKEPIAFAHFNLNDAPGRGFISNRSGEYSFQSVPNASGKLAVRITSIGYESQDFQLNSQEPQILYLKQTTNTLKPVVITPLNLEQQLLLKVIEKIPENYPSTHEKLSGRTIEEAYQDSAYQEPYYISTAKIEADKLSYASKRTVGNVTIRDGETLEYSALEETDIQIIAGIHNVHRFDFMMMRLGPLTPRKMDNYELDIIDTLRSNEASLIRLRFKGKDYQGKLYINETNYAVHRGEFSYTEDELRKRNSLKLTQRHHLKFITEYSATANVYRLRYINYQTAFYEFKGQPEPSFYLNNTFSIQGFEKATKQISFSDRVNFRERLADKLPQTLIDADSTKNNTPGRVPQPIRKGSLAYILSRVSSGGGVWLNPINTKAFSANLTAGSFNEQYQVSARDELVVSRQFQLSYKVKNGLEVFSKFNARKKQYNAIGIGLQLERPMFQSVRLTWQLSAQGGFRKIRQQLATESFEGQFRAGNRTFDSGTVDVYAEQRHLFFAPGLGFEYKIWPLLGLRFEVLALSTFNEKAGIFLQEAEERPFWKRKSAFVGMNEGFIDAESSIFESNLAFSIGLYFRY